jgi:hypothetical protein
MKYVVAQYSLRGVKNFLMENGINLIGKAQRCIPNRIIDTSLFSQHQVTSGVTIIN